MLITGPTGATLPFEAFWEPNNAIHLTRWFNKDFKLTYVKALLIEGCKGVLYLATHFHSPDWASSDQAVRMTKQLFSLMLSYKDQIWSTTPGEIWSYHLLAANTHVEDIGNNTFLICTNAIIDDYYNISITLKFKSKNYPERVLIDNEFLTIGDYISSGNHSNPYEFYRIEKSNGTYIIYVNITPKPGSCRTLSFYDNRTNTTTSVPLQNTITSKITVTTTQLLETTKIVTHVPIPALLAMLGSTLLRRRR